MRTHVFLKNLLLVFLVLFTTLTFICCGDTPEVPDDYPPSDGEGSTNDTPTDGENDENKLFLVKDGVVNFTFVYSRSDSKIKKEADKLAALFDAQGMEFKTALATDSKAVTDCEILVGSDVKYRDEYVFDEHTVGTKGYAITVKGNKVVINGGSADTIYDALMIFLEQYLGITESSTPDLKNLSVDRSLNVIKKQTYRITSLTLGEKPISDFAIVVDITDTDARQAANVLQESFYKYVGAWLDVYDVSEAESVENAIKVKVVDDAGDKGYRVSLDENGDLAVECAFKKSIKAGTERFAIELLVRGNGNIMIDSKYTYTTEVSKIYYSDYGAVGDGVTDDFDAIKKAHDYANAEGYTVVAEDGATYHMGAHKESIIIKTNVIWTGAKFILDDSKIEPNTTESKMNIFQVLPSNPSQNITTITSLSKGQTNIGVTFDQPMLVFLRDKENDDRRVYIRYGGNANSGSLRQEIILVDKDGNVDPSTPILFDYPEIGAAVAYPAGEKPITIKGGTFFTIANQAPRAYTYYNRGIEIRRSNTTLTRITHYVQGEGDSGAPYSGFVVTNHANNVLFDSMVFTGHRTYRLATDASNSMGTYEIGGANSNAITWRNCTQTNDINDSSCWGVMGTNFCKNLKYDGCKLSRFDAHAGMHNTTIINSELGHQKINAIGSGYLRIENCTINGNNVVILRSDYGSTWDGDVIIRNVHLKNTQGGATVFGATWYNHYFGYTCYFPHNITIDNLTLEMPGTIYLFPALRASIDKPTIDGSPNNNPVVLPQSVTIENMNSTVIVSSNSELFSSVIVNKGN